MLNIAPPWETLLTGWDTDLRAAGRPQSTRYVRCYHVRRFAHHHPDPHAVTRQQLVEWFAGQGWAPETRRSYRSSICLFFRWCVDAGHMGVNPALSLPTVRLPRSRPRPAPDDAVNFGLLTPDKRVRLMIYILALTGLRRIEVARIRGQDVEQTLDGWRLRVIGKGGHERFVPLDDDLAYMIRSAGPDYIFPGQIDGHLSAPYVGKLVSRALPEGWTAHTLRHRFATLTYRDSRDIRAVQELLGHASVRTTQIYTEVPDADLRVAARAARQGLRAA